jgi:arginine repressor
VAQTSSSIKTLPGLANGRLLALDGMNIHELWVHSGRDDTGLLAMRDNAAAERFCREIGRCSDHAPGSAH